MRYLAQNAHVFATSISENVRIGCKEATEDEFSQRCLALA
ncbi:transport ATP-binding protein CydC [Cutibacterium acnes JCM 18916]|nr:transport ATP-binding protein CydC [Cutibacterium acnes JCM 18916]GAE77095.1 transport ATP-binding protein CydC [Cutibacterium acnes JCM 18918]